MNFTLIQGIVRSTPGIYCLVSITYFLTSCAVKVNTFYDQTANFANYETFCWFENCEFTIDGPVYLQNDSLTIEVFKSAIVDELERKGYVYDNNNPDFLLHLHVVVEEMEGQMSSPYEYDTPDWQDAFPLDPWKNEPYVYLKGSMIIDIADAEESKMVWRCDLVEYMDLTADIADSRLKRGVRKGLKKFPPNVVK